MARPARQPANPLQDQLLQLALAMTLERAGQLEQVFAKESPIKSDHYRIPLLEYVAPAPLLRRMAGMKPPPSPCVSAPVTP